VTGFLTSERGGRLTELADSAEATARAAAQRAQVQVDLLRDLPELQAAADLLAWIWGTDSQKPPVSRDLLRALTHAGNYVAGASSAGRLVGASVGFLGSHDHRVVLHSHITGVAPHAQGQRVGSALKQHQRAWSLRQGLTEIAWTFDPLVRRNGYFNLTKLRARAVAYLPDFYGAMADTINADDESDRCLALWSLARPEVVAAASELSGSPGSSGRTRSVADDPPPGTVLLAERDDGRPVLKVGGDGDGTMLAVQVPADIVATRKQGPDVAVEWRHALRQALGGAFDAGYEAVEMTGGGWYLLEKPAGRAGGR